MIEVTGEHITKLMDADLRGLVARLCEAELRARMLPVSAVTAGGDQDAPDGGIDVRVDLPAGAAGLDFIRMPLTGFQVKHSDMPASAITAEMRPKGQLRASIRKLAERQGAYVIASSQANVTDSALQARVDAMKQAIHDLAPGSTLQLDFYDRERLAAWVRGYPGIALWLRERIGNPLAGWRGYGNWAYRGGSDYLLDATARLICLHSENTDPMPIEQGIKALREVLAAPRGIARLIGLSGVGKTRLAQALFDSKIGPEPLDSSIVVYADEGDAPNPTPRQMLQRLTGSGTRAIVVVDNCTPATHRALAEIAGQEGSKLSLITIELDIADDEPEETRVFRLEPASEAVVVQILQRLAPHVAQVDRRRIAEFSGGNARIALAVAATVKRSETLGVLNDNELFRRLFHQKQETDKNLERAAEVCSLVYSFDGEALEGDAELFVLADLADVLVKELYGHVSELYERGLVQKRSRWRAVLPHAIANRLAHHALERLPTQAVIEAFARPRRDRLLASFTRRLGYLHDSEPARRIAEKWLTDPTGLGDPTRLDDAGVRRFINLAPVAPKLALDVTVAAANGPNGPAFLSSNANYRSRWVSLTRSLAYDASLFDAAAFLLARFVAAEAPGTRSESASDNLAGLFHVILSGTHAPIEQRLALIRRLIGTGEDALIRCAMTALDATLEAGHFSSGHDFSFGARPRDFGWRPKKDEEVAAWFRAALDMAGSLLKTPAQAARVKDILARSFRSLWVHGGVHDELEVMAREIAAPGGWADGWIAARQTIRFDASRMDQEMLDRLRLLEKQLRPNDVRQRIDAYVLSGTHDYLDVEEEGERDAAAAWKRAADLAGELGRECASLPDTLVEILPETLRRGAGRRWFFGRGLAFAADVMKMWTQLVEVFAATPSDERNPSLLQGFIAGVGERDPKAANSILDQALRHPVLREQFPLLQSAVKLDHAGVARLLQSIANGHAQSWQYDQINLRIEATDIDPVDYKPLVLAVAGLPDGFPVALQMFESRLFDVKTAKKKADAETIALGRELLLRCTFADRDDNAAYHAKEIAAACLADCDAADVARELCERLAKALEDHRSGAWHYGEFAETLFRNHPEIALDVLVGQRSLDTPDLLHAFIVGSREIGPVHGAPEEMLIAWANKKPDDRYPKLAREVELFRKVEGSLELVWTPLAMRLLDQAKDRPAVLQSFAWRLFPRSWSGSLAAVLGGYVSLVRQLETHGDPVVRAWVRERVQVLSERIQKETKNERRDDERFE